jgi:hypothetical protein
MNAKSCIAAASAIVAVALVGCGSQAGGYVPGGTAPTRPAGPVGRPYPSGTHGEVDYVDTIWHGSASYEYFPNLRVSAAQVGPVVTRIRCSMETYPNTHAPPSRYADDTATVLPAATLVHAVKGFSPRCRLAVYVAGRPRAYIAVTIAKHGPVPRACARVISP